MGLMTVASWRCDLQNVLQMALIDGTKEQKHMAPAGKLEACGTSSICTSLGHKDCLPYHMSAHLYASIPEQQHTGLQCTGYTYALTHALHLCRASWKK